MTEPASIFGRGVRPIVFAHRGAAIELPENTLPSFERALELGADALEMDLHMTRDGVIVVAHDPTGWRSSGVAAPIKTSLLREVKRWDAGWGFVEGEGPSEGVEEGRGVRVDAQVSEKKRPFVKKGFEVPTFEEVLRAFPGILLNVDAKQQDPPLIVELLALLDRIDAAERVNIASFDRRAVREARRRGYRGRTGLAPAEIAAVLVLPATAIRAARGRGEIGDSAQVPLKRPLTTRWFVEKCRRAGITTDFWTVNDVETAAMLVGLGVDGIMTDDPRKIVPVVKPLQIRG